MKSKRYNSGGDLRQVLIGMIVDKMVCLRIAKQWEPPGLFDSPWANLIGRWCIEHLRRYDGPIGSHIRDVYREWQEATKPDEKMVASVERFLTALSDEYSSGDPVNSGYILDVAARVFNKIRLRQRIMEVEDELERNRVTEAFEKMTSVGKVELGMGSVIIPSEDYEAWVAAFDASREESLILYPGRLRSFLSTAMLRENFVGIMAPDKRGKSMVLLDAAFRAVRERKRVAYFDCGDMTERKLLLRLGARTLMRPYDGTKKIRIPVEFSGEVPEYEIRSFPERLTAQEAYRGFKKICKRRAGLRLSCHPNRTLSAMDVLGILQDWEKQGWVADVLVLDYADIMAPPKGARDPLDQIDQTWMCLRRISQEYHCLLLTATQSSALAYNEKYATMGRKHFSGRKTKLAHVDSMLGINVGPEDEKRGVMRFNWVVHRDKSYPDSMWVAVAGCLAICNPVMKCQEIQPKRS